MMLRRSFLTLILAALASEMAMLAHAADNHFPEKPIRLIVPFAAGGSADLAARVVGLGLSESLNTPIVVDNKPGGNGSIGAVALKNAPADGYTLFVSTLGIAINAYLTEKLPYDINKDFDPVSMLMTVPMVVVINPSLPVNTLQELVSYLKAHPHFANYGSAGNGGSAHLMAEYFKSLTGTTITHIPYKGTAPALADLVGGQVQMMFDTLGTSASFIKSGKVRLLAVTTAKRLPEYPNTPTMGEALGVPNLEALSWYGLHAPAGTPKTVVQLLSRRLNEVLKQPGMATRLSEMGALPAASSPEELARYQISEQDKWKKVMKSANIHAD